VLDRTDAKGGKWTFAAVQAKVSYADKAPIRCGCANGGFREQRNIWPDAIG
jgi:hypothetical protein